MNNLQIKTIAPNENEGNMMQPLKIIMQHEIISKVYHQRTKWGTQQCIAYDPTCVNCSCCVNLVSLEGYRRNWLQSPVPGKVTSGWKAEVGSAIILCLCGPSEKSLSSLKVQWPFDAPTGQLTPPVLLVFSWNDFSLTFTHFRDCMLSYLMRYVYKTLCEV